MYRYFSIAILYCDVYCCNIMNNNQLLIFLTFVTVLVHLIAMPTIKKDEFPIPVWQQFKLCFNVPDTEHNLIQI